MEQEDKLVYSVTELAKLLGIGRSKAYELVRSRTVPSLRLDVGSWKNVRIKIPMKTTTSLVSRERVGRGKRFG